MRSHGQHDGFRVAVTSDEGTQDPVQLSAVTERAQYEEGLGALRPGIREGRLPFRAVGPSRSQELLKYPLRGLFRRR